MKTLNYQVLLRPEPKGGFTVVVPSLPGCVTYGKDLKHAREMAKDAIEAYVASLNKHHEAIPEDTETLTTSIELHYAPTA